MEYNDSHTTTANPGSKAQEFIRKVAVVVIVVVVIIVVVVLVVVVVVVVRSIQGFCPEHRGY